MTDDRRPSDDAPAGTSLSGDGPPRGLASWLERLARTAWQLIVIAVVVVGLLWLAGELRIVLVPIVVAILLVRVLQPLNAQLRRRGWPRGLSALTVLVGFLAVVAGIVALIVPAAADEFDDLGPTLTQAVDDVERWLVESGPVAISRSDLSDARDEIADRLSDAVRSSDGSFAGAASLLVEIPTGGLLALLLTFFILKDADRLTDWVAGLLPSRNRPLAARLASRSWTTLGGFLRGAATLGALESLVIGLTMLVMGASLIVPVAVITFAAAFVPVAGAIVAGILAVLITLVSAGPEQALVVALVALVVQQLDSDLLGPVIYGRQLQIHPAVILVAVVAGGALFGLLGTFLAVPVTAVAITIGSELRSERRSGDSSDDAVAGGTDEDSTA